MQLAARRHLTELATLSVVGVGFVAAAQVGLAFQCPFRAVTGWKCPLCGGTTMARHLLSADYLVAWRDNRVLFVAGVVALLFAVRWLGEALTGRPWTPSRVGDSAGVAGQPQGQRRLYWAAAIVAATWTVARNLLGW